MNALTVCDYFVFRKNIEYKSEYYNFMKDLTGYIYNEKNKNDDAPDSLTALAKELQYHKLI
jgi:hypothetical protein